MGNTSDISKKVKEEDLDAFQTSTGEGPTYTKEDFTSPFLHKKRIKCMMYDNKRKMIWTGGLDKTVCGWNVNSGNCVKAFIAHTAQISCLTIDYECDEGTLFSGSFDRSVFGWHVQSGKIVKKFLKQKSHVTCMECYSGLLCVGGYDCVINVYQISTSKHLATLKGHAMRIEDMKVVREEGTLYSSSIDGSVRQWDIESGSCLKTFSNYRGKLVNLFHYRKQKCFEMGLFTNRLYCKNGEDVITCWNRDVLEGKKKKGKFGEKEGQRLPLTMNIATFDIFPPWLVGWNLTSKCLEFWDLRTHSLVKTIKMSIIRTSNIRCGKEHIFFTTGCKIDKVSFPKQLKKMLRRQSKKKRKSKKKGSVPSNPTVGGESEVLPSLHVQYGELYYYFVNVCHFSSDDILLILGDLDKRKVLSECNFDRAIASVEEEIRKKGFKSNRENKTVYLPELQDFHPKRISSSQKKKGEKDKDEVEDEESIQDDVDDEDEDIAFNVSLVIPETELEREFLKKLEIFRKNNIKNNLELVGLQNLSPKVEKKPSFDETEEDESESESSESNDVSEEEEEEEEEEENMGMKTLDVSRSELEMVIDYSDLDLRELDLETRTEVFYRNVYSRRRDLQPTIMVVRRENIVTDACKHFSLMKTEDFLKPLYILFANEAGLDSGGVTREFFHLLSEQILDPNHALFLRTSSNCYHVNPCSAINQSHLQYFSFIGKLIGKAFYDMQMLDLHFTPVIFKLICCKPITFMDLKNVDPIIFTSLKKLLKMKNVKVLDLNFSVDMNDFGLNITQPLKPDGENIVVTDENKREFVQLYAQWILIDSVRPQLEKLLKGVFDIIPRSHFQVFDEKELELILCGSKQIHIADWKKHTVYEGYIEDSEAVQIYWKMIETEMNQFQHSKLLQFITGTASVPIEGFKSLSPKFSICKLHSGTENHLPVAHTCLNRIEIPCYKSVKQCSEKVLQALELGKRFETV